MKTQLSSQARRELDRRFERLDLADMRARPHRGWIRAIRTALGMSQAALGTRLGITHAAVGQLEQAEAAGGITLAKLRHVAEALDCTLVYALVPNSSLEDTLLREAHRVAEERLGYVESTMALENQAIDTERQAGQREAIARDLIATGTVWTAAGGRRSSSR